MRRNSAHCSWHVQSLCNLRLETSPALRRHGEYVCICLYELVVTACLSLPPRLCRDLPKAVQHVLAESVAMLKCCSPKERKLLLAALSDIFHCDTLENRGYLRDPGLNALYMELSNQLLPTPRDVLPPTPRDVLPVDSLSLYLLILRWYFFSSESTSSTELFPIDLDGLTLSTPAEPQCLALINIFNALTQSFQGKSEFYPPHTDRSFARHVAADMLLLLSCHIVAPKSDVDDIIHTIEFQDVICSVLQPPGLLESRGKIPEDVTDEEYRAGVHSIYRLRSAGFTLIHAILESADAGLPRQQRYAALKDKYTDDDMLTRMFSLCNPSPGEIKAFRGAAVSRPSVAMRNRTLMKIVWALSAPDGIGAWINNPVNDKYMRQWISAVALWRVDTSWETLLSLVPTNLLRCNRLINPSTQDELTYAGRDEVQQAMVVALDQAWTNELFAARGARGPFDESGDLLEQTRLILLRVRLSNTAANETVVKLLDFVHEFLASEDLERPLRTHPAVLALEVKVAEIKRYNEARGLYFRYVPDRVLFKYCLLSSRRLS